MAFLDAWTSRLDVGDGVGEGNAFGADLDAILSEAAFLDAAVAGESAETGHSLNTFLPVGWSLKSLTWAMVAAPTKPVSSLNCGQTSMQQQQLMQFERG